MRSILSCSRAILFILYAVYLRLIVLGGAIEPAIFGFFAITPLQFPAHLAGSRLVSLVFGPFMIPPFCHRPAIFILRCYFFLVV